MPAGQAQLPVTCSSSRSPTHMQYQRHAAAIRVALLMSRGEVSC